MMREGQKNSTQMRRFYGSSIVHGKPFQAGAIIGARRLAKAVGATLGPGGRNVVIDPHKASNFNHFSVYPKPIITKDGVSVARHIDLLANRLHNLGSRLLIDAAE